jgi:hypothetical protein
VVVLAGTGFAGYGGDFGPASAARLQAPSTLAVSPDGSLLLSDGPRVRRIGPDGTIETIAGSDLAGFRGDGGPAVSAELGGAIGLSPTASGGLLIADAGNGRIRLVDAYPGNGTFGVTPPSPPAAQVPTTPAPAPPAPPVAATPPPSVPKAPVVALRATSSVKVVRGHTRVTVTVSRRSSLRLDLSRQKNGRYRGVHHWNRTLAAGRHVLDLGKLKAGRYRAVLRLTSGTAHRALSRTWRVKG